MKVALPVCRLCIIEMVVVVPMIAARMRFTNRSPIVLPSLVMMCHRNAVEGAMLVVVMSGIDFAALAVAPG